MLSDPPGLAVGVPHERPSHLEEALQQLALARRSATDLEGLSARFFANVSHELRTPLTLILGPAERLARAQGARRRAAP